MTNHELDATLRMERFSLIPPRVLSDERMRARFPLSAPASGAGAISGNPLVTVATTPVAKGGGDPRYLVHRLQLECGLGEEQIIGQLRKVHWLKSLPHSELQTLYWRGRHKLFPRYSTIMREGNEGNIFFVLLHGTARMEVRDESHKLSAGEPFGEDALVTTGLERKATVIAEEDCYVLTFSAVDVADLGMAELDAEVRPRVVVRLLRQLAICQPLTKAQRAVLGGIMEVHDYPAGTVVFTEGDQPSQQSGLYIILEGIVSFHKHDEVANSDAHVGLRTSADEMPWFGEGCFNSYRPRPCTVVCDEATKCLVVRAADFIKFLGVLPFFAGFFGERLDV